MFLALGEVLFGSPFYGVWVSDNLMLVAFCLMLFAWVRPGWAVLAAAVFALAICPGMYWTDSYWGGAVAASGGALVLLGVGLSLKRQTPIAGATLALGMLLLFWSRPYEGGVLTLAMLVVFARELWRGRRVAMFATAFVLLAAGAAWTAYDNRAVTGNPLLLPYMLHDRQYEFVPVLWFLPLRTPHTFEDPRLAAEHGVNGWEASMYHKSRALWKNPLAGLLWTAVQTLGLPVLTLGVLTLVVPLAWRDPLFVRIALVAGVVLLALACETYRSGHYAAPLWAPLALMVGLWSEHARDFCVRKPVEGTAVLLLVAASLLPLGDEVASHFSPFQSNGSGVPSPAPWFDRRAALIRRLSNLDRPQLVIVQYPSPDWRILQEWVYNGIDIDQQRVVFAHDLGADEDRALLAYYPNRSAVLLTFDPVSGQEKTEPYRAVTR